MALTAGTMPKKKTARGRPKGSGTPPPSNCCDKMKRTGDDRCSSCKNRSDPRPNFCHFVLGLKSCGNKENEGPDQDDLDEDMDVESESEGE